jgi:hypothetical protein
MLHYYKVILHAIHFKFYQLKILLFWILNFLSLSHFYLFNIILFVNSLKILWNFIFSLSLLTGQLSDRITAAFSVSLSSSKSSHSNKIWPTDCSPFLHEHLVLSIILYLYKYVLILPCPVRIVVNRPLFTNSYSMLVVFTSTGAVMECVESRLIQSESEI